MKNIQIEKYAIKCSSHSWLAKPGIVIYVEKDYNKAVNDCVVINDKELKYFSECIGMHFIYLPTFLNKCDKDLATYMTGRNIRNTSYFLQGVPMESVLSYEVFQQIKGPSLLFTGANEAGYCEAYTLPLTDTSTWIMKLFRRKRYEFEQHSLKDVFDFYSQIHGLPQIAPYHKEEQIFFRISPSEEPEQKSEERTELKLEQESEHEVEKVPIEPQSNNDGTEVRYSLKTNVKESTVRYSLKGTYDPISFFEEPETPSPFGDIDISDEEKIVREKAQKLIGRLLDEGLSEEAIWAFFAPERKLSSIKITEKYRIILPEYNNMEIPLPAVLKAVYFLFLRHPEGINFKDMSDYRDELFNIYRKLAERGTTDRLAATVDDLVNPLSNAMNEKCSRIKNMFRYYLDENLAKHYYISGEKGERKHIGIDYYKIKWMKKIV